jgi:hypothetical protein
MPLSPGDLLAGKYRIEAEIGSEAFGRGYRARNIAPGRPVAIKALHWVRRNGQWRTSGMSYS